VIRRLHASRLLIGRVPLDPVQVRHARNVLRIEDGSPVEVFDDAGDVGSGHIHFPGEGEAFVQVDQIAEANVSRQVIVASAIPKGERADWMVEKLSELGVSVFIPLVSGRSVVKPEGRNKLERWARLATESAKQSRRAGVMRIDEVTDLDWALQSLGKSCRSQLIYLSTSPTATPLLQLIDLVDRSSSIVLFIGPEGGWTEAEMSHFEAIGARGAKLTSSILRVETAAIVGASAAMLSQTSSQ
jgi:16S rRNA (uracil1498-N3)-methyltransferase